MEGKEHLLQPAGNTWPNVTQDNICLLYCKGTLVGHVKIYIHLSVRIYPVPDRKKKKEKIFEILYEIMCSIFLFLKYSIVWYTLTGFKVPVLYKDIKN